MAGTGHRGGERYRALFEATTAGIVLLDEGCRVVDANAAYCRIVGRGLDELVGAIESERGATAAAPPEIAALAAGAIDGFSVERTYLRPDGAAVRALLRVTAVDRAAGLYAGTVEPLAALDPFWPPRTNGEVVDLTERRLVLDELREKALALERAHELARLGTITIELDARVLHCSPEAARLLGVDEPFSCPLDEFRRRFVPDGERPGWVSHMETAYRRGGKFSVERRMRRASGETIWARVHGNVELDEAGRATRAVSVLQDVTERRALEERLRQTQKMEAVGQLASGVAHDFNNILLVIGGNAQLALAAGGDDVQVELGEIARATERAGELVRQLLAFSRVEPPEQRTIELNAVVEDVRRMLDRLLERTIEIRTELTPHDTTVFADPARLEQALLNLAVNARDAMPDGGTLTISTAAETGRVVLRVADTGEGMDEATRERIFEPFFTTKGSGKGTGLGLPAVYAAVVESDGQIDVESAQGVGTTFTIELPHAGAERGGAVPLVRRADGDPAARGSCASRASATS